MYSLMLPFSIPGKNKGDEKVRDTWNNSIQKDNGSEKIVITSWSISWKLSGVFPRRK